jgi:hypothetical protein
VKRNIEAVKGQIRRRRFIIAIDETHEPFYGRLRNLWIHDYRNGVKGATGSYKYIIVSMVSGDLRFILLVIPIPKISKEALLKEKGILDDKGPPQDMIYEELIGKFGYINGISLQHGG